MRFLIRNRWDLASRGGVIVAGTLEHEEEALIRVGDVMRVAGSDAAVRVIGIELHVRPGTVGLVLARDTGAHAAIVGKVLVGYGADDEL